MIYISSASVKHKKIKDSIKELVKNGFDHIELSGGTQYYPEYEKDLFALRDQYNLKYLLHSYFPPPEEDFILNLASLNDEIYQKTLEHYERAIGLSEKLGLKKYGFHAGFFIDFKISEIGRKISLSEIHDQDQATKRFIDGYNLLKEKAGNLDLYIENNVLSLSNMETFQDENPFMLTDFNGYKELKKHIDFKLLLDVAHLRVSAHSLGLNFAKELNEMIGESDYIHLSDNDGKEDQSRCFCEGSDILNILKNYDLSDKTITTETYGNISEIKLSQSIVSKQLSLQAGPLEIRG